MKNMLGDLHPIACRAYRLYIRYLQQTFLARLRHRLPAAAGNAGINAIAAAAILMALPPAFGLPP
jgi:hypothetical protein